MRLTRSWQLRRQISLDYITTAPPPNLTRLLHNTASYAGYNVSCISSNPRAQMGRSGLKIVYEWKCRGIKRRSEKQNTRKGSLFYSRKDLFNFLENQCDASNVWSSVWSNFKGKGNNQNFERNCTWYFLLSLLVIWFGYTYLDSSVAFYWKTWVSYHDNL